VIVSVQFLPGQSGAFTGVRIGDWGVGRHRESHVPILDLRVGNRHAAGHLNRRRILPRGLRLSGRVRATSGGVGLRGQLYEYVAVAQAGKGCRAESCNVTRSTNEGSEFGGLQMNVLREYSGSHEAREGDHGKGENA
jgi:hypothetical protein